MTRNPKTMLLVIVALIVGAVLVIFGPPAVKKDPRLGLDLKGGTRLTLEARPTTDVPKITPEVMSSLHSVIEKRVNKLGISESVVQRAGDKRLLVEIPGVKDPDEARAMLGKVGKLEFRVMENDEWVPSGVSGKDLASAALGADTTGNWSIDFTLNSQGAKSFGDLTTKLAPKNEALGIFWLGGLGDGVGVYGGVLPQERPDCGRGIGGLFSAVLCHIFNAGRDIYTGRYCRVYSQYRHGRGCQYFNFRTHQGRNREWAFFVESH